MSHQVSPMLTAPETPHVPEDNLQVLVTTRSSWPRLCHISGLGLSFAHMLRFSHNEQPAVPYLPGSFIAQTFACTFSYACSHLVTQWLLFSSYVSAQALLQLWNISIIDVSCSFSVWTSLFRTLATWRQGLALFCAPLSWVSILQCLLKEVQAQH